MPLFSLFSWASFAIGIVLYLLPYSMLIRMVISSREEQRLRFLQTMRRIVLLPIRIVPGISFHIDNSVDEKFTKQAVYICNHRSFFDIPICLSLCDKMTILIKGEYKKRFIIATVAHIAGFHFLSEDPYALYEDLREDIANGYSVFIFPEGTRSTNGHVGHFSSGAFTIARYFNLDIVPLFEYGLEHILPKGHLIGKNGAVTLKILQRIPATDHKLKNKTIRQQRRMFENYYTELCKTKESVCVIGGGMGGLFCGSILSILGYNVTVLEKNTIIGGGLQTFYRNGMPFNTGLHIFGGWEETWLLSHLLHFLGIKNQLSVLPMRDDTQNIVWTDRQHCYNLPRGRDNIEKYLADLFPTQQQGLHNFLDIIYSIADAYDHFKMRPPTNHPEIRQYDEMTVEQLLNLYISDDELMRVLSFNDLLCGGNVSTLPLSIYSMLTTLYFSGEYRFIGGSQQLADELEEVIWQKGGMVIPNTAVSNIQIQNSKVAFFKSADGKQWSADTFISAIPPKTLLSLTTQGEFAKKVAQKRIIEHESDSSVLSIYILLKKNTFPFINSSIYIPSEKKEDTLPHYILLSTPPMPEQDEFAQTLEILVPISYDRFALWENTQTMQRGDEYETYKTEMVNHIIDYLSQYYPIRSSVDKIFSATPLTIRDYYSNPRGGMFAQQGLFLPIPTRASNLYMTGQSIFFHGLCGVTITALLTATTIANKDVFALIQNTQK